MSRLLCKRFQKGMIRNYNLILALLLCADLAFVLLVSVLWSWASVLSLRRAEYIAKPDDKILYPPGEALWIHWDPDRQHFVDAAGRIRIFHGVNVIFKQPPFIPITDHWDSDLSFSEQDAKDLQHWGFNVVRLGVLWSGTFPGGPGRPDMKYIDAVKRIVSLCAAEGIYVVIDMHSDVLSRRFCGNGIPDWVVDDALQAMGQAPPYGDFPLPLQKPRVAELFPQKIEGTHQWYTKSAVVNSTTATEVAAELSHLYPNLTACLSSGNFFAHYFSNVSSLTFEALYTNAGSTRSAFEQHWKLVAGALQKDPNVLMYELINEPWPGNIYSQRFWTPFQWWFDTKYAESVLFRPFYQELIKAIRTVDDRHIVAYQPVLWNTWFTALGGPIGGAQYRDREVAS